MKQDIASRYLSFSINKLLNYIAVAITENNIIRVITWEWEVGSYCLIRQDIEQHLLELIFRLTKLLSRNFHFFVLEK
jgi:hypothetical protein